MLDECDPAAPTPSIDRRSFVAIAGGTFATMALAPGRASAAATGKLHFGYQPSTHQVAFIVAQEKGWWLQALKPLGVTDIGANLFPSGPPEMSAMLGGDLDVAYVGWAPPISAIARGLDAKVVCSVQSVGSVLCINPSIPYDGPGTKRSDPSVLIGKKFGNLPPGSTDNSEFRYWLRLKGIDGKLQLVSQGAAEAVSGLQGGAIDGHWVPEPAGALSEFNGAGKVVLVSTEAGPFLRNHACCCVLASGKLQREHPEIVEKIIETHITTTRWIWDNAREASAIASTHLKLTPKVYLHSVLSNRSPWNYDPYPRVESALYFAKIQNEIGLIPKPMAASDLFNFSFYDRVAARMRISRESSGREENEAARKFALDFAKLREDEPRSGIKFATVRNI